MIFSDLRSAWRDLLPSVLGATVLSITLSALQKLYLGVPHSLQGFVAAIVLGVVLGAGLGMWRHRDRAKARLLEERDTQTRALNAELVKRSRDVERALFEKGVLLAEVHHRVRNNLQILSSLLSLDQGCAGSAREAPRGPAGASGGCAETVDCAARWEESMRRRVRTLLLVHDELIHEDVRPQVSLQRFVPNVVDAATSVHSAQPQASFSYRVVDAAVDFATAVPLGLFLSELVALSLRRSAPASPSTGRSGLSGSASRILIELSTAGDTGSLDMTVEGAAAPAFAGLEARGDAESGAAQKTAATEEHAAAPHDDDSGHAEERATSAIIQALAQQLQGVDAPTRGTVGINTEASRSDDTKGDAGAGTTARVRLHCRFPVRSARTTEV